MEQNGGNNPQYMTNKVQPDNLPVQVGGIGTSGLFETNKAWNAMPVVDANDGKQDGDNHIDIQLPQFANGRDLRVKG